MVKNTNMTLMQYRNSAIYKMVFILSGFRNVLMLEGTDFIKRLADYRSGAAIPGDSPISKDTMKLIDAGFEMLTAGEVRLYSNYIARIMNYDEILFYNVLRGKAERIVYDEDKKEKMIEQQINTMYLINRAMRKRSIF